MTHLKHFLQVKTRIEVHADLQRKFPGSTAMEISSSSLLCLIPDGTGFNLCLWNFVADKFSSSKGFFPSKEAALKAQRLHYKRLTGNAKQITVPQDQPQSTPYQNLPNQLLGQMILTKEARKQAIAC